MASSARCVSAQSLEPRCPHIDRHRSQYQNP